MKTHPAFVGHKDIVPLSGFSGAMIGLMRTPSGHNFVRKAASRPEHSVRLRRQAERQSQLVGLLAGVAGVPQVERDGEIDGCYWFDMAFAVGRDAVGFLSEASHNDFDTFTFNIGAVIERLATSEQGGQPFSPADAIRTKCGEIDVKTSGAHSALLDRLIVVSRTLDDHLFPTASHGDLTLENIIVDKQDRLWLIDSIDSPFDHYWMDLTKLFQDCEGRWFLRRGKRLSVGLTWELRNRLLSRAVAMNPTYGAFHYLLLSLTFARILPYTHSADDRDFVVNRVTIFANLCSRMLENFP